MSFLYLRQSFIKAFFVVSSVFIIQACRQKVKVIKSPPHYKFSEVQTTKLDLRLKEISGIAWDPVNSEFLAHQDENGQLFLLDKESKDIKPPSPFKFAGKGDYEDVAIYNGVPYILRSDGQLTKIIRDSAGVRGVDVGKLSISGLNDFETLYTDTSRKALILLCKNCAMDTKSEISAFAYYPDSIGFVNDPVYRIDADAIKAMAPNKSHKFQPTAAEIHPVLNKLFIISSPAKQLVIADLNGKPEGVYELGRKLFPQPEGLTFKKNGDMYISSEGVTSKGTIMKFLYKP